MKKVELKRLTAENFRGQSFDYAFGHLNKITGRNGSGKSSVKNAFLWLVTGADEDDMTNKNLFDEHITPTKETSIPVIVTGILSVDGYNVELKRTAKIGWVRRRGEESWVRKGTDDYTFTIDSIDRSATEYKSWIEENFAPMEKIKIMLNIMQFIKNVPDWKTQRMLLSEIVGDITDDDFSGDYKELFEELERFTPEQIQERIKNKLAPLKDALGTETKKGEKVITLEVLRSQLINETDIQAVETELQKLKEERADIQRQISGKRKEVEPLLEKRNKALQAVEEKKMNIYALKHDFDKEQDNSLSDLAVRVRNAERENAENAKINKQILAEYEKKKSAVVCRKAQLKQLEQELNDLREENVRIKSRMFSGEVCAYCGQKMPEDKIVESRAAFERKKEKERNENIEQGKRKKFLWEAEKAALEILEKEVSKEPNLRPITEVEKLQIELAKKRNELPLFEDSDIYKTHISEIAELEKAVPPMPVVDTAVLDERLAHINKQIDDVSKKCGQREILNRQKRSIEKVEKELREMSIERAALERIEQQLKEYEEEKANIVGDRVNRLLEYCHIDMFSVKKDGMLSPNCEVKMRGVGKTMNTASEILAGIDISNAFCKYYDISLPLFVDNFELLSSGNANSILSYVDRQLITLCVDDNDISFSIIN